jgi:hypothetical protein
VRDLTEEEVGKLRDAIDQDLTVEGDLRRERSQDIKRLTGDRLLPRHPPPPRAAGARPEHEDQRPHAQGSQAHAGGRQEEGR